ncbi:MAG: hypothetical protein J6W64_04950 [Bacilli bacterium]|nr:hypothetical protein [Bacilli bacterium]
MNNKIKLIILILLLVLLIGIDLGLFYFKMLDYLLVLSVITIALIIFIMFEIKKIRMDDNKKYDYTLKKMLKIYNPVLVETKNFPDIKDKSILKVGDMDDLLNAQYEIKKPIYYIKSEDSTVFYILDNDVILVYFIKKNENTLTSLEIKLDNLDNLDKIISDLEVI